MNNDAIKLPPHSIEAEQMVIGSIIIDSSAWDEVADLVTDQDFYRRDHRLIFMFLSEMAQNNQTIDVVTLAEYMEAQGELEQAGGMAYLGEIAKNTPTAANAKAYAQIVRSRSIERQLIQATNKARSVLWGNGKTEDKIEQTEQIMSQALEAGAAPQEARSAKQILPGVVDRIDRYFQQGSEVIGLSSGYVDFDKITAGLQDNDLIIVAGRPSMGKTAFAMGIAGNAALNEKCPALVFSMEMDAESLIMREQSRVGHIDHNRLRRGQLSDDDWPRLTSAVGQLAEAPLYIDDSPALTVTEIRARARRAKRKHGIGLVVVDYIQLMRAEGHSRDEAIGSISRGLKAIAKELRIPVIALSQLNRDVEKRPNKRPRSSDLRESGSIEQDADLIVFIYRDEVYNDDSPDRGIAEIIIDKQRNGETGMIPLTFLGQYCRFENFYGDIPSRSGKAKTYSGGFDYEDYKSQAAGG